MNEHHQPITAYLRQTEAQVRIQEGIHRATSNMAVTISRAASLFNFSESQLREWEKRGLLQTERPVLSPEGRAATGTGHRQYSLRMVTKLAIIRDLINQGYGPGEIPLDIDRLWEAIASAPVSAPPTRKDDEEVAAMSIDARVERTDAFEFWRYFVTQTLRLALLLICEDMPDTVAGLVLSLNQSNQAGLLKSPAELAGIGPALVGWRGPNSSFYLMLTDAPTFDFPTDYRLQDLKDEEARGLAGERVLDNTFIVLERGARPLPRPVPEMREVVRRLLNLIYNNRQDWELALTHGSRDWLYQVHNLERASHVAGDRIFNMILERMIELGGKNSRGQERWRFCTLLLPDDIHQPVQQQNLVVRAQTRRSPFQIGITRINAQDTDQTNSITLKAFESSQIVYLPTALPGDSMLSPAKTRTITSTPVMIARGKAGEGFQPPPPGETIHSALTVPVLGDHNISIAVLYLEASEPEAFSPADMRVLRMISRMLEELLMTSVARSQSTMTRDNLLAHPALVDSTFDDFAVESDFIAEIDLLLRRIQKKEVEPTADKKVSLLAVDIDNQSSIAMKYGNRIARNLSQQVGTRIISNMTTDNSFKIFHISADRYYLLLEGMELEDARKLARQLRQVLRAGAYQIQPLSATAGKAASSEHQLALRDVTVHVGVSTYTLAKLDELLHRYPPETARVYVRTLILAGIDTKLERGKVEGGDCIVSWDVPTWGYIVLPEAAETGHP